MVTVCVSSIDYIGRYLTHFQHILRNAGKVALSKLTDQHMIYRIRISTETAF